LSALQANADEQFIALEMTGREALETYCPNTAAQAELRLVFCRRKHAVIARAFGISPAQSR